MRVLFCIGYQKESINKEYWLKNGIGGSEYCVINLAEEFASNGHDVFIAGDVISSKSQGVTYVPCAYLASNTYFELVNGSKAIHY